MAVRALRPGRSESTLVEHFFAEPKDSVGRVGFDPHPNSRRIARLCSPQCILPAIGICFRQLLSLLHIAIFHQLQSEERSVSIVRHIDLPPDRPGHGFAIRHSHPSADAAIIGGRGKETSSKSR